jgi:hypothetical protein
MDGRFHRDSFSFDGQHYKSFVASMESAKNFAMGSRKHVSRLDTTDPAKGGGAAN